MSHLYMLRVAAATWTLYTVSGTRDPGSLASSTVLLLLLLLLVLAAVVLRLVTSLPALLLVTLRL